MQRVGMRLWNPRRVHRGRPDRGDRARVAPRQAVTTLAAALALLALALRLVLPAQAAFARLFDERDLLPVCTAQGIVWKALAPPTSPPAPEDDRERPPHCPLCLAQGAALLAASPRVPVAGPVRRDVRGAPERVEPPLPQRGVAAPRGPPVPAPPA